MSVADLYELQLVWPSLGPKDVIATGTFDQWSSSIRLVKGDTGFVGVVNIPWGQKIAYKFIVDGRWQCRDDRPQEDDGNGNINNILQAPSKPALPPVPDPPARLFIPLDRVPSEYGDIDNMVTAVEFFPPAEPAAMKGSLPLPIPQIAVDGLGQALNESKLNTAAATEGNISPASVAGPAEVPSDQAPTSHDVTIVRLSDDGSVPLPPINGNGEASDGLGTHAPIQFAKGDSASPVPETLGVVTTPESAAPQTTESSELARAPAAGLEPTSKEREAVPVETVVQGRRQQAPVPAFNVPASTSSTLASSTVTHKKRRSLLARIKHMFDKDKNKQEKKEKNRL